MWLRQCIYKGRIRTAIGGVRDLVKELQMKCEYNRAMYHFGSEENSYAAIQLKAIDRSNYKTDVASRPWRIPLNP